MGQWTHPNRCFQQRQFRIIFNPLTSMLGKYTMAKLKLPSLYHILCRCMPILVFTKTSWNIFWIFFSIERTVSLCSTTVEIRLIYQTLVRGHLSSCHQIQCQQKKDILIKFSNNRISYTWLSRTRLPCDSIAWIYMVTNGWSPPPEKKTHIHRSRILEDTLNCVEDQTKYFTNSTTENHY